MLLGRLSRVAQRTSSVHLTRTFRPVIYGIRQYSAAAAQPVQTPVQEPLTPLDFIPDEIFKLEMVREAESLITSKDEFERAEAMLTGALDYIAKNDIKDSWAIGSAHANLAYVLQQRFKYDAAMSNYGIGLQNLSKEPVRDSRFVGLRQLGFAELLSLQGQHALAATTSQAAIAQLEKALKDSDPLVGIAYSNLAAYRMLEGKANLAVGNAERGLKILEATLGKHNDVTRNSAINVAKIYKELGRTREMEALDSKFLEEDEPILALQTGNYAPEYLDSLKSKWKKQGPRKIFDPPGLHRSAALSANSYNAFVKAWKAKGLPISTAAAGVLSSEFKSLEYSHDQLKRYIGRPLPKEFRDAPEKYETGFEKLKIKGLTSLATELDKQATLPPLLPEDVTITEQEWKDAAERQRTYRAAHGDPTFDAAQEEFSRSEAFFEGTEEEEDPTKDKKKKKKSVMDDDHNDEEEIIEVATRETTNARETAAVDATEDGEGVEEGDEEAEIKRKRDRMENSADILVRLAEQDDADEEEYIETWDRDTYDAYTAVNGGLEGKATQREFADKWRATSRFTKVESTEDSEAPLSRLSDEELHNTAYNLEHGEVDRALLAQMYTDLDPPGLVSEDQEELRKPRPAHQNPHYLKYRRDYLADEGLPTYYDVVSADDEEDGDDDEDKTKENAKLDKEDKEDDDDDLDETEEPEEEEKLEEVDYEDLPEDEKKLANEELKSLNIRGALRVRPEPEDLEDEFDEEEPDLSDFEDRIEDIETAQAAAIYKSKLRKRIEAGEPLTPELECEKREMDYEKWVDTEVRQTLKEEVSKEIERRKAKKAATPPSPYEFNPEEDDSFTYGPNEKPVRDVDEANQLRDHAEKEDAQENKKPKYGKLHETPWHNDFESI